MMRVSVNCSLKGFLYLFWIGFCSIVGYTSFSFCKKNLKDLYREIRFICTSIMGKEGGEEEEEKETFDRMYGAVLFDLQVVLGL